MKRDWLTPFGIIFGVVLIYVSIFLISGLEGMKGFISLSSALTVVGGVLASLFVGSGGGEIKNAFSVLRKALNRKERNMKKLADELIELAHSVRKKGVILALKDAEETTQDPFMKKGMDFVANGYEPELIRNILETEINVEERKYERANEMWYKAGELAPAWGMVGTVIGLVLMLQQMNDVSSLGPAIALALITTFYGVLLAHLVFLPLSNKLIQISDKELFEKEMMLEAFIRIRNNQNPTTLKEELYAMLPPELRIDILELKKQKLETEKKEG